MKKIMSLMLGLTLIVGSASLFAQDKKDDDKKTDGKGKGKGKGGKKGTDKKDDKDKK
jgi:hypothetical protein